MGGGGEMVSRGPNHLTDSNTLFTVNSSLFLSESFFSFFLYYKLETLKERCK